MDSFRLRCHMMVKHQENFLAPDTWGMVLTPEPSCRVYHFMKISEMSKSELAEYMRNVTHEIGLPDGRYRFDHTPTWKRVFKLARQNGYENLEMDCGKCIEKAAKWIAG